MNKTRPSNPDFPDAHENSFSKHIERLIPFTEDAL